MNSFVGFGINPITKSSIKWDKVSDMRFKNVNSGGTQLFNVYASEVVKIMSIEEVYDFINSCAGLQHNYLDSILMPCLTLKEQEMVIDSLRIRCGKKLPKQLLYCVHSIDFLNNHDLKCTDPATGEALSCICEIYRHRATIAYYDHNGILRTHIMKGFRPEEIEETKAIVGDKVGIKIRLFISSEE